MKPFALFLLIVPVLLLAIGGCTDPAAEGTATSLPPPPTPAIPIPTDTPAPRASRAYPPPAVTEVAAYPAGATATGTIRPRLTAVAQLYLPAVQNPPTTATPTVPASATPLPTPTPTVDFAAVRAELQTGGQDLGFVKMGFHIGPGGNHTGLGEWMQRLDAAGVPFFLKAVDTAGPLLEAQQIAANSDVPHTLVYRSSGNGFDVPNYDLPPAEAARQHWERHKPTFPPELDPGRVWFETINEIDKGRATWLAEFALTTAQLALADGYRWAAFGWASGEPEPATWESPAMLEFLRLAAANPERLAIALHEYSYTAEEIADAYPYKVGRFQQLFEVCDRYGIPRPTVLITEWGWEYDTVPPVEQAMADIRWAARLYAPYPQVKGAAIWYLGPGFAGIADQVQPLIRPVTEYALGNYFPIPLPPEQAPINPDAYRP